MTTKPTPLELANEYFKNTLNVDITEICQAFLEAAEVIEYYADKEHWTQNWIENGLSDYGHGAREWLAKHGEKK